MFYSELSFFFLSLILLCFCLFFLLISVFCPFKKPHKYPLYASGCILQYFVICQTWIELCYMLHIVTAWLNILAGEMQCASFHLISPYVFLLWDYLPIPILALNGMDMRGIIWEFPSTLSHILKGFLSWGKNLRCISQWE